MNQKQKLTRFLLVFLGVSVLSSLLVFFTGYTQFTCERLEIKYVTCQQQKRILYGIINRPTLSFRLRGVNIDKETKTDDEGDIYELYSVYILADDNWILLDSKKSNPNWANKQKQKIKDLIRGVGDSIFKYRKGNFFDDIITTIFVYIALVALIKKLPN